MDQLKALETPAESEAKTETAEKRNEGADADSAMSIDEDSDAFAAKMYALFTFESSRELQEKIEQVEKESSRTARQEKLKLQQQLRDVEEEARQTRAKAVAEKTKAVKSSAKAKADPKRKLESTLENLETREIALDRELRKYSGARMRPLGRDRFWNRYWWFDGFGSGIAGVLEHTMHTGAVSRQYHLLPYATGRLFVEGAGQSAFLGHVSGMVQRQRRKGDEEASFDHFVTLPQGYQGIEPGSAIGQNWLKEGEWAYYETPEQGVRESALKSTLQKYMPLLEFNMQKRMDDLEKIDVPVDTEDVRTRVSTRLKTYITNEKYMKYKNRWE